MKHRELNSVSWTGHNHNTAETGYKKSEDAVSLCSSAPLSNWPALESEHKQELGCVRK